jgi:hypothetical protein
MKIRVVGAEFIHADGKMEILTDGRTDRNGEADSGFSQLCERI